MPENRTIKNRSRKGSVFLFQLVQAGYSVARAGTAWHKQDARASYKKSRRSGKTGTTAFFSGATVTSFESEQKLQISMLPLIKYVQFHNIGIPEKRLPKE